MLSGMHGRSSPLSLYINFAETKTNWTLLAAQSLDRKIRQKMKKILVTAAILILGAVLGVGCYLAYQHFQSKEGDPIKTLATVKEKEPETASKHRLNMKLAVTDAEKEFFAMMNNYFDSIDKAVSDKKQGRKTDFKEINLLEAKIAFYLLFNEDKIRKELMRKELLPLAEYYEQITKKYGIDKGLKENALIKTPKPKKEPAGLISGPNRSYTTNMQFKNGRTYDTFVISDTYIYRTNNGENKRVVKSTSYEKVDLNDYLPPCENVADYNCTEIGEEECKYLQSKNVYLCDTTIQNNKLRGWYHISKRVDGK